MSRICLQCGDKVLGRSDKKFCTDQCRSAHNNKLNSDKTQQMRNINNSLRKNRRILHMLAPDGSARMHRDKLANKGFNFEHITGVSIGKDGAIFYFCYDIGYVINDSDYITIFQKKY